MSKNEKVLRAIAKKPMSAKQIKARFDIPNVSALIHQLRLQGFDIVVIKEFQKRVKYSV